MSERPPPNALSRDAPALETLSFEKAMEELESIVKRLEAGRISLDDAIETYERGAALRRHCERKLAEAQARIDRIAVGPDGVVTTEPFDAQR